MPHSLNVQFCNAGMQDFKTVELAKNGWTVHAHPPEYVQYPKGTYYSVLHLLLDILTHASLLTTS